ncbi:MAG: multidrug efflux RND transporter permease subunit [Geminicoccaceae bacterium]
MFSKFFIDRPIFAAVVAIVTVLLGAVALLRLPIAQYPDITPPTIYVTTSYPGASAATVANTVGIPIEQQVNGVPGMLYMQSYSASDGTYTLIVTFQVGTDMDTAQTLVYQRVAIAQAQLPTQVAAQGVTVKQQSTNILLFANLISPSGVYDSLFLTNYASINLQSELARVPGVAQVNVVGAGNYSMRIWLDPLKMQSFGLVPDDVTKALQQQNAQVAAGQIGIPPQPSDQPFQYTINVLGRLDQVAQFEDIVVKAAVAGGGELVRVRDVARVELGAQTYSNFSNLSGMPTAGLAIYQLPTANALAVAKAVKAKMAELKGAFPQGLDYTILFDTTVFVNDAIQGVIHTLVEAGVLVFLTIFIFLQDWRGTLIPTITIPVSLIGTFALLAAFGLTINLISLFGLVLAIAIVVDDAIVVVENVWRIMEQENVGPKEAAIKAMGELGGAIAGVTLTLMSVFVPATFLPGITGQMYQQFALVLASSTALSAINALTLTPALCAILLRKPQPPRFFLFRWFNSGFGVLTRGQTSTVGFMIRHKFVTVVLFLAVLGIGGVGFTRLPTGFLPEEDQGYAILGVQLPSGSALARTKATVSEIEAALKGTPGIAGWVTVGGVSLLDNSTTLANGAVMYLVFTPFAERVPAGLDQRIIIGDVRRRLAGIDSAVAFPLIPPAIPGLGVSSGFQMQLLLQGGSTDLGLLAASARDMIEAARSQSGIAAVNTSFTADVPQIFVDIDRTQAESLGVQIGDVFSALQAYTGSSYVNQFNLFNQSYQTYVQADSRFRLEPGDIERLRTRNKAGEMVPLGALASIRYTQGSATLSRYNLYPTVGLNGASAPGFSSGQAMAVMSGAAADRLPTNVGYAWTGMSYQEQIVGNQAVLIFALSIFLVFLVLAALYESWTNPFAVILAVPLALLGVVGGMLARGFANDMYCQIGIVLMIAMAAKNAILVVEFARGEREKGVPLAQAAINAAHERFRPIMMTSLAFILGMLPLASAQGAGAAGQQVLGTAVLGGMITATLFNNLFVPPFYVILQGLSEWLGGGRNARNEASSPAASPPAMPPPAMPTEQA